MGEVTMPVSEDGFSLPELLVSMSLMLILIAAVYMMSHALSSGTSVTERQAQYSREITTPMHVMDKMLSENKALESGSGFVCDGYTLTARAPLAPDASTFERHVFTAGTDGTFKQTIYTVTSAGASTLKRTNTWSKKNANRAKGVVFTYLDRSGNTTTPVGASSVQIRLWTVNGDKFFSGQRRVYFRNRD